MKIKLSRIVNSRKAMERLLEEKFPVKVSRQIIRNFKLCEPDFLAYEEDRYNLIVHKYGIEKNGMWNVPPERNLEFQKELSSVSSIEVELDILKVKLPDDCNISPIDMYLLEWMLEAEDENKSEDKKEN